MIKIILLEYDEKLIQYEDEHGQLYLDIDCNDDIGASRYFSELSEFQKLKIDGIKQFSLKSSKKNLAIFRRYIQLNNRCLMIEPYKVQVLNDGYRLYEDVLYFNGYDGNIIEVTLGFMESHWLFAIKDKKLTEYNLDVNGVLQLMPTPVTNNWQDYEWQNGSPIVWLPLFKYGQIRNREINDADTSRATPHRGKDVFRYSDLRPWISAVGLLKTILAEEGWCLKSNYLESAEGRAIWMYLLKGDYYLSSPNRGELFNFQSTMTINKIIVPFGNYINFDDKVTNPNFDNGNNFVSMPTPLPALSYWRNPLGFSHEYTFSVYLIVENNSPNIKEILTTFEMYDDIPGTLIDSQDFTESIPANTTQVLKFEWTTNADAKSATYVKIGDMTNPSTPGVPELKAGSYFSGKVSGKMYYKGDYMPLNGAVKDYSISDIFKGILHTINGKIVTEFATKTITIEPYPKIIKDSGKDITDKIVCNSLKIVAQDTQYGKYTLKYKDSGDAAITEQGKQSAQWAKVLDINKKVKEEYVDENPFFEPFIEEKFEGFHGPSTSEYASLYLPVWKSNTEGTVDYDIPPLMGIGVGYLQQNDNGIVNYLFDATTGAPVTTPTNKNKYTDLINYMPYLSMCPKALIGANALKSDRNLVYGNKSNDLYFRFHRKQILEEVYSKKLQLLGNLSINDFMNENFIGRYTLTYNGEPLKVILKSIEDFKLNKKVTSIMNFIVDKFGKLPDPCSCVFNSCDYFMDIAPSITNLSLNELEISSFKIGMTEYVTTPVVLGNKVLITYNSYTYVLNLVNAINSLAIPGVLASPAIVVDNKSNQLPQKYFNLQTPECESFECIVRLNHPGNVQNYWKWSNDGFFYWTSNGWDNVPIFSYYDMNTYNCQVIAKEIIC